MSHLRFTASLAVIAIGCSATMWGQSLPENSSRKREQFRNAEVTCDRVINSQGQKIRTIVTKPKSLSGKVPAIFFVGWLSCDSVEYADGETDGFGAIFWGLIEKSGFATMRADKPGVGESEGTCSRTNFQTELDSYRAAFDSISKYPFIDQSAIYVVGLSNGGGFAPLAAGRHSVRGYVAASSWGRTWYEHMLENERARLDGNKKLSAAEINDEMRAFTDFYSLYLMHRMTPGEIIGQHPEWKSLWYDAPNEQYGRPAAFYQQLQSLNLGKIWQEVDAPVLVLHGTADPVMSASDSVAISDMVNRTHPGRATYREIPGADHLLALDNKLDEHVVSIMIEWMKNQPAKQ